MASPGRDSARAELLPAVTPGSLGTRQVEELVAAWRRGERLRAEDVLARHPELGDEAAIRLIYEEACLRLEAGLPVDPAEVARRFPRWRDEIEVLLDCQVKLQPGTAPASFPEVGEVLAGFRIAAELGRARRGASTWHPSPRWPTGPSCSRSPPAASRSTCRWPGSSI